MRQYYSKEAKGFRMRYVYEKKSYNFRMEIMQLVASSAIEPTTATPGVSTCHMLTFKETEPFAVNILQRLLIFNYFCDLAEHLFNYINFRLHV